MDGGDTRIERLTIAARQGHGVPMVAAMVAEAFRLEAAAVGPAVHAGLLVIRRIDLGPVGGRADQGALNQRVARALRGGGGARPLPLPPGPAAPPEAAVAAAPAVLFPDAGAPARRVLAAIGAGRDVPRSWPYRAVIGPDLFAPPPVLAARLIARIAEGPAAAPALAEALCLLGPHAPEALAALPPGALPDLAALLIAPAVAPAPVRPDAPPVPLDKATSDTLRHLVAVKDLVVARLLAAARIAKASNRPANPRQIEALLNRLAPPPDRQGAADPAPPEPAVAETLGPEGAGHPRRAASRHHPDPAAPLNIAAAPAPGDAPPNATAAGKPPTKPDSAPDESAEDAAARGAEVPPAPFATPEPPAWPDLPVSRHAGLVLLIALADRAFGGWLNHPAHMGHGTGQRLLRCLAARLPPSPGDPWLELLSPDDTTGDDPPAPAFHLPAGMAAELRGPVAIAPLAGRPGWRVATVARGRIALGAWQGRAPAPLRRALAGRKIVRAHARDLPLSVLLSSASLALRLWLRRQARLSLSALVRRPGRVQVTHTHLDVIFDASLVSLAVRRHGLDLSPGWCAWLWRVVTIHYDFDGTGQEARDA